MYRYSQGRCTGWRRPGTRSWRWRVRGKSSGAYRSGHGSGSPWRRSVPLPSVSPRKRGRWSRSARSDWDESVPRTRRSCSEPVSPTGHHSNSSVSSCSAICGGTTLRSRSRAGGWWFRTMTAAWWSFLKKKKKKKKEKKWIKKVRESCDWELEKKKEQKKAVAVWWKCPWRSSDHTPGTSSSSSSSSTNQNTLHACTTHKSNQNTTLPCFGCNRCCKVSRTSADRWHISPTSQIANCMISPPRRKKPRAVVSKAVTLRLLPSGSPLSPSPSSAACQQQVVGSAEALCSASLAKCTGLIALLHMHPLPLY